MSRVLRTSIHPQAAFFGMIENVAKVERERLYGPEPEPVESQIARYQASEEARRVVTEAYAVADSVREEARQAGYEAGWAEGYACGKIAAEAEAEHRTEQFRAEYRAAFESLLAQIEESRRALWLDAEPQMVSLVMEMARRIVKEEAAINPDVILSVVKNALRRVVDSETVRIRVNSADLSTVRAARTDMLTVIDGVRTIEVIEDRRVGQGGCVIETGAGTIDARIETQSHCLEETLRAASGGVLPPPPQEVENVAVESFTPQDIVYDDPIAGDIRHTELWVERQAAA